MVASFKPAATPQHPGFESEWVLHPNGWFYGTTEYGGSGNKGMVIRMNTAGDIEGLASFEGESNGADPLQLTVGNDNNLYGVTEKGGANNDGTVFSMTPDGNLTTLVHFDMETSIGAYPRGGLVQGPDGTFYGTTAQGGANSGGTLFAMTPAGVLTNLIHFDSLAYGASAPRGRMPYGTLIFGADGNLYGTTASGGANDWGTIFRATTAGVLTTVVSFTGNTGSYKGTSPLSGLTLGTDGKFYGTTSYGGAGGEGTVFSVKPSGDEFATLEEFSYGEFSTKGINPSARLTAGPDGKLYGKAMQGGGIFSVTTTGVVTQLVKFNGVNGTGFGGSLTLGSDGKFYGMCPGGAHGQGMAYSMTVAGVLTTLADFVDGNVGSNPKGSLTLGTDGKLYGMTSGGGGHGYGTLFTVTLDGEISPLVHFTGMEGENKGANPEGSLTRGPGGKLYGMTPEGGANNCGTIFSITPAGVLTTLVEFTNNEASNKGAAPKGSLTLGTDGNFYGLTSTGGTYNQGTVFSMTPAGVLTTLVEFNPYTGEGNNGGYPQGSLILGPDGNFYGTTSFGGNDFIGTVFSMTPAGELTTLAHFSDSTGNGPPGDLALGEDGNFYGVTEQGGIGLGNVFTMTPEGELTSLVSFTGNSGENRGANPKGTLTLGADGNFYGMTYAGYARFGSLFSVTPEGVLTTLAGFTGTGTGVTSGRHPGSGRLIAGSDGHLYGMTANGGAAGYGLIFRIRDMGIVEEEPVDDPIAFAAANYTVNQGVTSVVLTLTRPEGDEASSVTVQTDDGTASTVPPFATGVAGADYVDLAGAATTVEFAAGETSKTVAVTLIPRTGTPAASNRRFTATLSNQVGGGDTLGAISTATVRIAAADTVKPTLTITTPAAAATTVSAAWPYAVIGTAGDAKGIDRVEVVLNGGAPVFATLKTATANTAVPYTLNIEPVPGANTLKVTAYDFRGNNLSVTRNFTFVRRYVLSLNRTAPTGIALGTAGTVTLTATPAASASALTPSAVDANPKTSSVLPTTPLKVTATPKTGYSFSHWEGLPSGAVITGNSATFSMPAADAPSPTAHFVANFFGGPVGSSNVFYGLIHPESGTQSNVATEGFLTGTLTPLSGAFTGSVRINGLSQAITLTFYGDGTSLFTVGTAKQPSRTFGGYTLTMSYASGAIEARLTNGSAVSSGTATRGHYSATKKVAAGLLNYKSPATAAANTNGMYTIAFPAMEQTPAQPISSYPQGDGYATLTLTSAGLVTVTGVLADGTTLTGSSGIVAGDICPILLQLTTPGAAATVKGGAFFGTLTFDTAEATSDVSGLDFQWMRPAVSAVATPAAAAAATNLYTAGWPNGIRVNAIGALYDKTATVQSTLGLGAADPTLGNAQLMFAEGKLVSPVTKTNFNLGGNVVTKIPANDASFTLTTTAATGLFNGTFTPNWATPSTAKPAFKGILIQKGASKGGFGFFLSNAKDDTDPESGGVTLEAQE